MNYKLSKSKQIREDYERYKQAVEKINNKMVKKQYEVMLSDFLQQVKIIEESHDTFNNGYIDPKNNRENIIRLIELRRKLNQIIK